MLPTRIGIGVPTSVDDEGSRSWSRSDKTLGDELRNGAPHRDWSDTEFSHKRATGWQAFARPHLLSAASQRGSGPIDTAILIHGRTE